VKLIWNYDAPPGTEDRSVQSNGRDHVWIMQNGNPAKALYINTVSNQIEKHVIVSTKTTGTRGQFRHMRLTAQSMRYRRPVRTAPSRNDSCTRQFMNKQLCWFLMPLLIAGAMSFASAQDAGRVSPASLPMPLPANTPMPPDHLRAQSLEFTHDGSMAFPVSIRADHVGSVDSAIRQGMQISS